MTIIKLQQEKHQYLNKKGELLIMAIIAVGLLLFIIAAFVVDVAGRECNNNKDCSSGFYCGADNQCHNYPSEVVVNKNNLVLPSLILSIGLIIAALLYKDKMPKFGRN